MVGLSAWMRVRHLANTVERLCVVDINGSRVATRLVPELLCAVLFKEEIDEDTRLSV